MGQCGCGDLSPYKAFRVGEYILVVEIYHGCQECDTGIMFTLNMFSPEEAARWGIEAEKEFKPDQHGWSREDFPLIGQEDLLRAWEDKGKPIYESWGYDNMADFLADHGLELLQEGLAYRLEEVRKAKEERKAKGGGDVTV